MGLHVFGDTSGKRTSAVVYAVVYQDSGISQGLLAAKARLAKKNMSIPHLELISAQMAANLVANVKDALQGLPIGAVYGCTVGQITIFLDINRIRHKMVKNAIKVGNIRRKTLLGQNFFA